MRQLYIADIDLVPTSGNPQRVTLPAIGIARGIILDRPSPLWHYAIMIGGAIVWEDRCYAQDRQHLEIGDLQGRNLQADPLVRCEVHVWMPSVPTLGDHVRSKLYYRFDIPEPEGEKDNPVKGDDYTEADLPITFANMRTKMTEAEREAANWKGRHGLRVDQVDRLMREAERAALLRTGLQTQVTDLTTDRDALRRIVAEYERNYVPNQYRTQGEDPDVDPEIAIEREVDPPRAYDVERCSCGAMIRTERHTE